MNERRKKRRRRKRLISLGKLLILLMVGILLWHTLTTVTLLNKRLETIQQTTQSLYDKQIQQEQKEMLALRQIHAQRSAVKTSPTKLTAEELDLIIRVIITESRGQPVEGQRLVAQTIYDRVEQRVWGSSVTDILTRPKQFAPPYAGDISKYPAAIYAAYSVFVEQDCPSTDTVLVFFNPDTANRGAVASLRSRYELITVVGQHEFRGIKND